MLRRAPFHRRRPWQRRRRREKRAGNFHLFLPMLLANRSRRDRRAPFAACAVGEQRGKLISLAVVPIPNPIQASFAFGGATVRTRNRVAENVAARHLIEREPVEKGFAQRGGQSIFSDDTAPSHIARVFGGNFRQQFL